MGARIIRNSLKYHQHISQAKTALRENAWGDAISSAKEAIKHAPPTIDLTDTEAYHILAQAYAKKAETEAKTDINKAIECYKKSLSYLPDPTHQCALILLYKNHFKSFTLEKLFEQLDIATSAFELEAIFDILTIQHGASALWKAAHCNYTTLLKHLLKKVTLATLLTAFMPGEQHSDNSLHNFATLKEILCDRLIHNKENLDNDTLLKETFLNAFNKTSCLGQIFYFSRNFFNIFNIPQCQARLTSGRLKLLVEYYQKSWGNTELPDAVKRDLNLGISEQAISLAPYPAA